MTITPIGSPRTPVAGGPGSAPSTPTAAAVAQQGLQTPPPAAVAGSPVAPGAPFHPDHLAFGNITPPHFHVEDPRAIAEQTGTPHTGSGPVISSLTSPGSLKYHASLGSEEENTSPNTPSKAQGKRPKRN